MNTFADILAYRATREPDRIAYGFLNGDNVDRERLTYGHLHALASAMALRLREQCSPGDRALIMLPPGLSYLVAMFGCFASGVVAVPLYAATSRRRIGRLREIIIDADATSVISDAASIDRIKTLIGSLLTEQSFQWIVADRLADGERMHAPHHAVRADSLALIQYTSGSTGNPKGVQLTHANLIANSGLIAKAFGCDRSSRGVIWLPPHHDMGLVGGLLQPMFSGFECTLFSPEAFLRRPATWLQAISDCRATHSGGPNFAYELCAERISDADIRNLDLSAWKVAFNGAETVRPKTLERFSARFREAGFSPSAFLPCYGLAEATLIVTGGPAGRPPVMLSVDSDRLAQARQAVDVPSGPSEVAAPGASRRRTLVSSGRLLPGATIILATEDGTECLERQVGEIYIAGDSVSPGYWEGRANREQPVQRMFASHPGLRFIATGDLGFLADGELYIAGRKKDVIVIRGRNVYPEDLDATVSASVEALRTQPCAAFLAGENDDRLVVAVELDGRRDLDHAALRKTLFEALGRDNGVQPDTLLFVRQGTLPLTSSGKVQRWACRQLFESGGLAELPAQEAPASSEVGARRTPSAAVVATAPDGAPHGLAGRVVSLVAHVGELHGIGVGLTDTLTALGFDSLKVLQLSCQLEEQFGISPGMSELLDGCTVADLVAVIRDAQETGVHTANATVPVPPAFEAPLEVGRGGVAFPLSPAQESMWFLHSLSPDSSAYNVSLAFRLSGSLSISRLQAAFDQIVRRHAPLRTVYRTTDQHFFQYVLDSAQTAMRVMDAGGWSAEALDEACSKEAAGPFNLYDGPVFRLTAYVDSAVPTGDTVLQIVVHHIAADFWSLIVLVKELSHIYDGLANQGLKQLPVLGTTYAEYAAARVRAVQDGRLEASRQYWRARFADEQEPLNFPADRPRPSIQSYVGEALPFKLPVELAERLKSLVEAQGVTMHMFLLAAFQALLHRYTDQTDITIGVPNAGRQRSELHNLIGYFVNPIPVRCIIDPDTMFAEHLAASKRGFLRDLAHAEYPFAQIVSDVVSCRDPSIHPLFQVMFVFQQSHLRDDRDVAALVLGEAGVEFRGEHLRFESRPIRQRMSPFDFHVSMAHCGDTLIGSVQYNTDLFDRGTIERLIATFVHVLETVSADLDCLVADIPLLKADEAAAMAGLGRQSAGLPVEATITRLFERACARHPDNTAVAHHLESLTYRELKQRADGLTAFLVERGVVAGQPIGIMMERSAQCVIAMLATLKAGCPYLLCDINHPLERQLAIMRDAAVQWLICNTDNLERTEALMWAGETIGAMICVDRDGADAFEIVDDSGADRDLWDYVAQGSQNDIQASGWMNSYTGEYFTPEEMREYVDNTLAKLRPYLSPSARVLEIGCGSGLTMFAVAPHVASYFGTDLSPEIIAKDRQAARARGIDNVTLAAMPAHAVGGIDAGPFDVIIMNSVVQLFSSHQYLRAVLKSCVSLLAEGGTIFVGDVMDLRAKERLLESLREFKQAHPDEHFRTKLNWDRELFLAPGFFVSALEEFGLSVHAQASGKCGQIDNELKRYRFDITLRPVGTAAAQDAAGTESAGKTRQRYWRDDLMRFSGDPSDRIASAEDLAYICYTSGTTGTPKGIAIPHRGVVRLVIGSDYVACGPTDRIAHLSNLAFDATTFEIWGALLNGASLHIFDRYEVLDPHALLGKLRGSKISVAFITTPLFHQAARVDPAGFGSLSSLLVGGEAMNLALARKVLEAGPPRRLLNVYGPTENTTFSTWYEVCAERLPAISRRGTVPIGRPIRGSTAYILDRRGRLAPTGVAGELHVGGTGLALGYIGRPALTAEKFISSPHLGECLYRTGDKVRWNDAGEIEFLGRFDTQIKVRGFRVEPAEIEEAILRIPQVLDAAVVAEPDEDGRPKLAAYVVMGAQGRQTLDSQQLREFLSVSLPDYMIPAHFVAIDALPLTTSGKLDRRALSASGRDMQAAKHVRPATTETEQAIVRIWEDVLAHGPIGIDDNLFELGGHSLMATQVVSRMRAAFGIDIPLRAIFEEKTLLDLAALVDRQRAREGAAGHDGPEPSIEPQRMGMRDRAPVSFAQQRLWLLDQLYPNSNAYNIPTALRLDGPLDRDALRHALAAIVGRHEALRTTFGVDSGVPFQRIHKAAGVDLPSVELGHLPADERDALLENLMAAEAAAPFSLVDGPLFRVRLYRLADDAHVLQLTMHHIVSDGWSMGVIQAELTRLYAGFASGDQPRLAPLPVQYADYTAWQRERLSGARLEALQRFWHEALDGYSGLLALPYDFRRQERALGPGARVPFEIGEVDARRIAALASELATTPFTILLATFFVVLAQWSQQRDICVGTPVAGRQARNLEALIGFFVNTIVIRGNIEPRMRFAELIEQVRHRVVDAYSHQELPFEKVVEESGAAGGLDISPIFQVMFALQNTPAQSLEIDGLSASVLTLLAQTAKFDLFVNMTEADGKFAGYVEYRADLFHSTTIERIAASFVRQLSQFVAAPGTKLNEAHALAEVDAAQLRRWNETGHRYGAACVIRRIEDQAARRPGAVALAFQGGTVGYGELDARANGLARALRQRGVGAEVPVGVCIERSPELLVALLGIWKAGGAYVPLDPQYPDERLNYMLSDSGARLVLAQPSLAPRLAPSGVALYDTPRWPDAEAAPPGGPGAAAPDQLAYIIYTSGSTGRPKGAMLTHRGLANRLDWMRETYGLDETDRFLQKTPYSFDVSVWELFLPLLCGATLVIAEPEAHKDPEQLGRLIEQQRITAVHFVPSMLAAFVSRAPGAWLNSVRHVFCSGEALPPPLLAETQALCRAQIHNLYGPTEASIDVTAWSAPPGGAGTLASVPIGRPIWNTRTHILDASLNPVPVGVPGELYLGGIGVGRGYINRADLTAERFLPDPQAAEPGARMYRTGDLARFTADGEIEYLGRTDHQVKVRGFRIELGEIEAALRAQAGVEEAVVVADTAHPAGTRLVAYVAGAAPPAAGDLRAGMRRTLPEYMVPSVFVGLAALPLNASGKVDRRALPAPDGEGQDAAADHVAPAGERQEALHGIWSELLGRGRIGAHDNFFEIGGHSLLATQLVSRIRDAFGVDLPLRSVFLLPTIAQQAGALASQQAGGERIERADRSGPYQPASFSQRRLWFLDQLHPGSAAYNMPGGLRLEGRLDIAALERALDELVRRHEVLRTTFALEDGEPVQRISERAGAGLERLDLRDGDGARREARWRARAAEEAARPFDLGRGPLLRAVLLELSAGEHILLLTLHHIVSDGWSMGIVARELSELYGAFAAGRPSPLAPLPIQYADYAHWQQSWRRGDAPQRQLAYWRGRLGGAPRVLNLPTDFPRPPVQTHRGALHRFELEPGLGRAVAEFSRRQGVTPFMTLLAAFKIVLSRYSGQRDIVVGTPIANRTRTEVEGLIGCFVNTLALRTEVAGGETVGGFLARVKETTLGGYAHQDVPFEQLVDELQGARQLSHPPLFQVMFVLQNAPRGILSLPGVAFSEVRTEHGTAKFDLTLVVEQDERGEARGGALEYNTDLYRADTAARLQKHWCRTVAALVASPHGRLDSLPMLDGAELAQLGRWNETGHRYGAACVIRRIEEQAARRPGAVALAFQGGTVSYGELDARANGLARALRRRGVGAEVPVGVCIERSPELLVALLGIWKAGGAYVPLDPQYPDERLNYMLSDSGARLVLAQPSLAPRLAPSGVALYDTPRWPGAEAAPPGGPGAAAPDQLAYIIYTSGSTGRPKGAMLTHRGLANLVSAQIHHFGIDEHSRIGQFASSAFDAAVSEMAIALCAGATLVLPPADNRQNVERLAELISVNRISVMTVTPSMLSTLTSVPDSLATVVSVGEALPRNLVRDLAGCCRILNAYGPTEATVCATISAPLTDSVTIGRPIWNTRTHILDASLNPVPVGVPGELYLGGIGVGRGYINRADLTAERFLPDPQAAEPGARMYRTGDLARFTADGEIEYLGRTDHQVKIRGFRIELGEIEAALRAQAGVEEAVVVADTAHPSGTRLVAYVAGAAPPAAGDLRAGMRRTLPEYMVPSVFVGLAALPLNASGKVDRRALPAPTPPPTETDHATTPFEQSLLAIFERALGCPGLTSRSDLSAHGFDSLTAVRITSDLEKHLGLRVSLLDIYRSGNVHELAETLSGSGSSRLAPNPVSFNGGDGPPLVLVHAASGSCRPYHKLAKTLSSHYAVYSLQSPALFSDATAPSSLSALAQSYNAELERIFGEKHITLVGWSIGGLIALEMASLAHTHRTYSLAGLTLIDPTLAPGLLPGSEPVEPGALLRTFLADMVRTDADLVDHDRLATLAAKGTTLPERWSDVVATQIFTSDAPGAWLERLYETYAAHIRMLDTHVPAAYPGAATIYLANGESESATAASSIWRQAIGAQAVICHFAGDHHAMLDDPAALAIATDLCSAAAARATGIEESAIVREPT